MTIKITWKAVAIAASAALTIAAAYYACKRDAEEREKIKKHKEEALEGRDLLQEINDASIRNEKLESDDRATAYKVLEEKKTAVDNAYYISDFDKALDDLDNAMNCLTQDSAEACLACLIVYKDRLEKRKDAEKYNRELERDRERNRMELEKAATIAKAIKSFAERPSEIDKLFEQVKTISIGR